MSQVNHHPDYSLAENQIAATEENVEMFHHDVERISITSAQEVSHNDMCWLAQVRGLYFHVMLI
jgi:hypothetical protein